MIWDYTIKGIQRSRGSPRSRRGLQVYVLTQAQQSCVGQRNKECPIPHLSVTIHKAQQGKRFTQCMWDLGYLGTCGLFWKCRHHCGWELTANGQINLLHKDFLVSENLSPNPFNVSTGTKWYSRFCHGLSLSHFLVLFPMIAVVLQMHYLKFTSQFPGFYNHPW